MSRAIEISPIWWPESQGYTDDDDVDEYCEHCGMYFTVCECDSDEE